MRVCGTRLLDGAAVAEAGGAKVDRLLLGQAEDLLLLCACVIG